MRLGLGRILTFGVLLGTIPVWCAASTRTYRNPIIFADYSDPDIVRAGDDFYLISSEFHLVPGIPILHSRDLIRWRLIGHVYPRLTMDPKYDRPGHGYGQGCWAPSIRYHEGRFWVYFCTPGEGLYMSTALHPAGPWEPLHEVRRAQGWEDPCPFWDDDGNAYLVRGAVFGGPMVIHRMSWDGRRLLDDGTTVYHNIRENPVLEGFKMHKRNGWYYIWGPAGGVENGWQTVLRSTCVWGPYEARRVLEQGPTPVNGPHQGGFVELDNGEAWFVHFQSSGCFGRIVHLQPMRWEHDWPVIGQDTDGNGVGEPVLEWRAPSIAATGEAASDDTWESVDRFDSGTLASDWQWNHNPRDEHWSLSSSGGLTLTALPARDLRSAYNTLTRKLFGPRMTVTVELDVTTLQNRDVAGLCLLCERHSWVGVVKTGAKNSLRMVRAVKPEDWDDIEEKTVKGPVCPGGKVWLRVHVAADQTASYAYSLDGVNFTAIGPANVPVTQGWWKGAKVGLFAYTTPEDRNKPGGQARFLSVRCSTGR